MSKFCAVLPRCYSLCDILLEKDTVLPLSFADESQLKCELGSDKHTYLLIGDGRDVEQIKLFPDMTIERGLESREWLCGADVYFYWTEKALNAWMECRNSTEPEEGPDFKIPGYTPVWDPEEGQWCFEPDAEDTEDTAAWEWEACGYQYTWNTETKCLTRKCIPLPADQIFDPARVSICDGKPSFSQSSVATQIPSCGGCGQCGECGECFSTGCSVDTIE